MVSEHIIINIIRAILPAISIALAGCHFVAPTFAIHSGDTERVATVKFIYPSVNAVSVCVAGDFNGWSTAADCLSKRKDGFALEKRLSQGRYKYQFVIDSKTMTHDSRAGITEDDGFGGKNSVLVVE